MVWCGLFLFLIPAFLSAQEYPTKPINMVITFSPGGSADPSVRLFASQTEKFLGQPFIITNNGGGGGSVAMAIFSKERPDGYHLAGCSNTSLIRIRQFREVPYKLEDFVPIMHFGAPPSDQECRVSTDCLPSPSFNRKLIIPFSTLASLFVGVIYTGTFLPGIVFLKPGRNVPV